MSNCGLDNTDKVLVFMPTLNEANSAERILKALATQLAEADFLVIDDGSIDGTLEELRKLESEKFFLIERGKRFGVGSAHREAILYAKRKGYDFIVTLDADGTHRVEDVVEIYKSRHRAGLIIGSRFVAGAKFVDWPLSRIILTHCSHFVTKAGLKLPYDCSSGLRCYSVNGFSDKLIGNDFLLKANGYDFFFKSVFLFNSSKISIYEQGVTLEPRSLGKSKMNFVVAVRSIASLLISVVRFRIKSIVERVKFWEVSRRTTG